MQAEEPAPAGEADADIAIGEPAIMCVFRPSARRPAPIAMHPNAFAFVRSATAHVPPPPVREVIDVDTFTHAAAPTTSSADDSLRRLKLSAFRGDAAAQSALAARYLYGSGGVKNPLEAYRLACLAAGQGDAEALYLLYVMHRTGTGTAVDMFLALVHLIKAGNLGHARSQHMLGVCYALGIGTQRNSREALAWFELAAQQGYAKSQFELGKLLEAGIVTVGDPDRARDQCSGAAQQGHIGARHKIAALQMAPRDHASTQEN